MFSPENVLEIHARQSLTRGGKRHALLDDIMSEMQAARRNKGREPSLPLPSARGLGENRMPFADFMKKGWNDELPALFSLPEPEESVECIENIKGQFTDFTFLLDCGKGSFGHVWLVQDMTGMIVALKMIPRTEHASFQHELSGLTFYRQNIRNFRNLVQIHHVGQTKDFFFYTMDAAYSLVKDRYIPLTLKNLLRFCVLTPLDGCHVVTSLLEGLAELHGHMLSHRDVKPDNVIFVDGTAKLCDMGLISPCSLKDPKGTRDFIPPDYAGISDDAIGISCDLYAMGKVLYTVLINDVLLSCFPWVPKTILRDSLGKRVNKVINTACAPTQSKRFRSAMEFIAALEKIQRSRRGFLSRIFH